MPVTAASRKRKRAIAEPPSTAPPRLEFKATKGKRKENVRPAATSPREKANNPTQEQTLANRKPSASTPSHIRLREREPPLRSQSNASSQIQVPKSPDRSSARDANPVKSDEGLSAERISDPPLQSPDLLPTTPKMVKAVDPATGIDGYLEIYEDCGPPSTQRLRKNKEPQYVSPPLSSTTALRTPNRSEPEPGPEVETDDEAQELDNMLLKHLAEPDLGIRCDYSTPIYLVLELLVRGQSNNRSLIQKLNSGEYSYKVSRIHSVTLRKEDYTEAGSKVFDKLASRVTTNPADELPSPIRLADGDGKFSRGVVYTRPSRVHYVICTERKIPGVVVDNTVYLVISETKKDGVWRTCFPHVCCGLEHANEQARLRLGEKKDGEEYAEGLMLGAFWGFRRLEDRSRVHVYVLLMTLG